MIDQRFNQNSSRRPWAFWWVLPLLIGTLIGAAGVTLWSPTEGVLSSRTLAGLLHRDTRINLSTVVERIQRLQRLETIVYTSDQVVEGDRQSLILPGFLAGDRLLLIAHGEVIAGVDLAQVIMGDIHTIGRSVQVNLPEPQIFVSRLDNSRSRVYSRTTGLLVSADPNLETEVRGKAEQQIREAALADGVLQKARENARTTVRSLLLDLGFEKIDVN